MKHLPVYIGTSNNFTCCLPATAYLFNKFWPEIVNVKVLGYDIPDIELPPNFEFISLGKQRGPAYWSNDMAGFFSTCSDEYFYWQTEDMLLIDNVDEEILDRAIELFEGNTDPSLLRFCVSNGIHHYPYDVVETHNRYQVIERVQNTVYRNSVVTSIWNRENFLKELKPMMSPWDFELKTGRHNNMRVLGTTGDFAVSVGHGYKKGKKRENWYNDCLSDNPNFYTKKYPIGKELNKADRELLEANNWIPTI